MSANSLSVPFPIFNDIDGDPLDAGYIYIGTINLDPVTNPISVFFDEALTILASQPIRTINGFPSNSGSPARLFVAADDYSITVKNKNGSQVYTSPVTTQALSSGVINYTQGGTGSVQRTLTSKLQESVSVLDYGAVGDGVMDDTAAIQTTIPLNAYLPKSSYGVASSLLFDSESTLSGAGANYGGTRLVPSTDTVVFKRDPAISAQTRMKLGNFMVEGDALTTQPAIDINECYLFTFEDIWLKDCYQGVNVSSSDSINFNNLRVVETTDDYAITLGDSATNIDFVNCNFETGAATTTAGKVKIDGNAGLVTSATFTGCQFERSGLDVYSGTAKWIGGKIGDTSAVKLLAKSSDCYIDSDIHAGAEIHDFGAGNVVKNAFAKNMSTPEHKWPVLQSSTNAATFGAVGEEWLYLTTVGQLTNTAASNVTFDIKDGATVLDTSPTFSLFATGNSRGLTKRPKFSWLSCVKNPTGTSGPVTTYPLNAAQVAGGLCLNSNATFDSGTSTGWLFVDASGSASGSDLLVTPTNSTWGIYQVINSGICKHGKRYIAVAKFSGNAALHLGAAWDGSAGTSSCFTSGVPDLYGDGDTVAMISFQYHAFSTLSLGSISSSSPVTLKWFALIEA